MPEYLYGCNDKNHPKVTIFHGMLDNPILECEVCHAPLHRIPQKFLWGISPLAIIAEWSARNTRHKRNKEPREYMYSQVSSDRGKPQKDFNFRK